MERNDPQGLSLFNGAALDRLAAGRLLALNTLTEPYGLRLTPAQAGELVETRSRALRETGRLEIGGGILERLVRAFCDSPYLRQTGYAAALHTLAELFYTFKNELPDTVGDEELLALMRDSFNGVCGGSLELLAGRELERMARNLRFGRAINAADEEEE